jgi:predicted nucleic acid-binding Zn ribbon protein
MSNLTSTSWSCARCGAAFISTPPEHGLCEECLGELEVLAHFAPVASQACPACGGPVCADCRKALIVLTPAGFAWLGESAGEVNGDGG